MNNIFSQFIIFTVHWFSSSDVLMGLGHLGLFINRSKIPYLQLQYPDSWGNWEFLHNLFGIYLTSAYLLQRRANSESN